jgi:2-keto-4-pentenoate hydratase/2-oxohepta-3-ene-1,7-dioic acid hydratase in catechol pathway
LNGGIADWAPAITAGQSADSFLEPRRTEGLHEVGLLPPVEPDAKIVCCGVNYQSHVEPLGASLPSAPVAFLKAQTALIGQSGEISYPAITDKLDYEIELVCIVGARQLLDPQHATASLLGYTIGNDVTARDLQRGEFGLDLYSSKSLDDTCGMGPWITTKDEILTRVDLPMTLRVNGEVRQHDRTSGMHWGIDELLLYADSRTRLCCGDALFTGTPGGAALESGRFLSPGDVVEATIDGIGTLVNTVGKTRKNRR